MEVSDAPESPREAGLRRQEVVAQLGQEALESDDLDKLMREICDVVATVLDNEFCKVLELLPGGDEVFLRQGVGWRDGLVGSATVPTDRDSQAGYTLISEQPIIVDDLRTETRFSGPELLTSHDVVSGISVIIGSVEEPWGVLGTHTTERRDFTQADATFVQNVANILATAIEREHRDRALERAHQRMELAMDVTDATVWEWEVGAESVTTHPDPHSIFGSELQTVEDFYDAIHPADRSQVEATLEQTLENGAPFHVEYRYEDEGSVRWVEDSGELVTTTDGRRARIVGVSRDITDRKERERELEEYEAVTNAANDVIVTTDTDGTIQTINPAVEDVFGYAPTDVVGESVRLLIPELTEAGRTTDDSVHHPFDRWTDGEYTELAGQRADGSELRLGISVSEVTFEDERFVTAIIRDITETRAQAEELDRSHDLLRHTERIADVGGWEIDPERDGVFWSDHLFEILGIPPGDEPPVDRALDVYHEDDRSTVERAIERALGEQEPIDVEARFETPGGELRWLHIQGEPEIEDGEVVAVRGAAQDITDRKERERALEASERRYRTLVENFPHGAVGLFDQDLRYTAVGGQLLEITAQELDDPVGDSILDRYPDDMVERIEPHVRAALHGTSREFEVEYRDHHLLARTVPVRNADDEVTAGMVVVLDITERREYQQRLEESHERLEEFASAVSHDLREPLGTIASYLQLLERRYENELDEDAQEFIDFTVDGATRMQEMIDGLVTAYARVDEGDESFAAVDLQSVLDDVLADLRPKIEATDAEITSDALPQVTGDRSQLNQLFLNLVDNAIKYAGATPPRVELSAERDGDRWVISVRDEGIGMDPENTDDIFEVFQRLHPEDEYPGTGIGLALCEHIVERHGGEIWVDAEPGVGSTFSFTLPAIDGQE